MSERGRAHKRDRESPEEDIARTRRRQVCGIIKIFNLFKLKVLKIKKKQTESSQNPGENNSVSSEVNSNISDREGFRGSSSSRGNLQEQNLAGTSRSFDQRCRGYSYRGNSRNEAFENSQGASNDSRGSYQNNRSSFNNNQNSRESFNSANRRGGQSSTPSPIGPIELVTNFFEVECKAANNVGWVLYQVI